MPHSKKKCLLAGLCAVVLLVSLLLGAAYDMQEQGSQTVNHNTYVTLPEDDSDEDPLAYIGEDFTVSEGFHSNLPIVLLEIDGELPEYKYFSGGEEQLTGEDPWTTGSITVIDGGEHDNALTDEPAAESSLKIKKRGHTSYSFDKEQYLIKLEQEDGTENAVDILGMGAADEWILNGSMADKSMIRNYLSYRIASEIMETAPDSQFCEVLLKDGDDYVYQGLYLMMETVARGTDRVNIDKSKNGNTYTSYIIRRDRFTNFDPMLETYGRLNDLSPEWIGVKYPSEEKLTEEKKNYIETDFSAIEQVLYSDDDDDVFGRYSKYIDTDSFVDYFLVNEFFGNYDSGEHSTYMYKNSGEVLKIGPVWDFDQAMNNYFLDEMETDTMAMQEKPFFKQLTADSYFVSRLESRYAVLRKSSLSEDHVNKVIDEAVSYIRSARIREWNRWAEDYEDDSGTNVGNYYLQDYMLDGVAISRFNDNYEQEIYNIKVYLHKHGNAISTELPKLEKTADRNTGVSSLNELFLAMLLILFMAPSIYIIRKG